MIPFSRWLVPAAPPATRSDARADADAVQELDAKLDALLPPRRHFCESCHEVETLPDHEECGACEAQRRRP